MARAEVVADARRRRRARRVLPAIPLVGYVQPPRDRTGYESLVIDVPGRQAWSIGRELGLTAQEHDLLEHMVRNVGLVLSHGAIYEAVWGCDLAGSSNVLAMYVGYARRKMEAPGERRLLHTVRGVGYVLR